jgi:uncharacterized protein
MSDSFRISNLGQLRNLYDEAHPVSLSKESDHLTPGYKSWLEKSPFFAFATLGSGGLDCTPRGDEAGQLLHILDTKTLLIPDRRGNNRLDSLENIIQDPRVAMMFVIPGITECLRVNGQAFLTTDPMKTERFKVNGKPPKIVIQVAIDVVYFQCARAIIRSKLWDIDQQLSKSDAPTAGEMIKGAHATFDATAYDEALPERQKDTLY